MNRILVNAVHRRLSAFILSATLALGSLLVTASAQAQCGAYPIALSDQSLAGLSSGAVITNIWNGAQPGNFGWLTWSGDPGEPTLVDSLSAPGDSSTYVNPDNANDHNLGAGKWASGRPGVSNGKHVRGALDSLIGRQIVVPVWDQVRGQGSNAAYHISAFAIIEIISYQLPSQNRISARFIGYTSCDDSPGV